MKKRISLLVVLVSLLFASGCGDQTKSLKCNDKEYIIMRCGNSFYSVSPFDEVFFDLEDGMSIPQLANGQFARMTADVTLVTGGYEGYQNKPFINTVIQINTVSLDDILSECAFQNYLEEESYNKYNASVFFVEDQLYFISGSIYGTGEILLYTDGKLIEKFQSEEELEKYVKELLLN